MSRNYMVVTMPQFDHAYAEKVGRSIMGKIPAVFYRVVKQEPGLSHVIYTFDNVFSEDAQDAIIETVVDECAAWGVIVLVVGPGIETLNKAREWTHG